MSLRSRFHREAGYRGCRSTARFDAFVPNASLWFGRIRGFPWRVVPRGSKTLGNVPLAIDGMLVLWGEGNAKSGAVFPEKVDDIPVNRVFDTLYVYHAAFYSSRDGSPVYHLTCSTRTAPHR